MSRLFALTVVAVGLFTLAGCGSSSAELPKIPEVDNRPAEVKEVDDAMQKQNELVSKGIKKR